METPAVYEKEINEKCLKNHLVYHNYSFFDKFNIFICIFIILVNFFVVLSSGFILHKGQQPRATYIFLGNISFADMIIGIVTLFILTYPHQLQNETACSLSISFAALATMTSVFSIALIAIDRYLYILYGLHYHSYITTRSPHCMVFLTWFLSALLAVAPIFIWRNPMNGEACWFITLIPPKVLFVPVSTGIVPLALIVVLYGIILKKALDSRSKLNCNTISSSQNQLRNLRSFRGRDKSIFPCSENDGPTKIRSNGLLCCRSSQTLEITPLFEENKWKAVKIVTFTAGAFFITWFPYFVTCIFYVLCEDDCENIVYLLSNPMSLLSLCNSLFNPLIYSWWHPGFRRSVKKMYSGIYDKMCQKQNSSGMKSAAKVHKVESLKQIGREDFDSELGMY